MERPTSTGSCPNGAVIRFEIPGFGITCFRPEVFAGVLSATHGMSITGIVLDLRDMGWDFGVMEYADKLTLIEWIAIYGESTGHGMD
ncbi:hypothetical protein SEA_MOAB_263 [Streptomyces phage Moab]|nr:hypothetical protein SEA_MOAB_263 [Streptomyces phage Moab]WMI33867.1 hypothetical protein SEA_PATELGO_266 [Streptomyces phage Patelgo]